jgi:hypothetical protein
MFGLQDGSVRVLDSGGRLGFLGLFLPERAAVVCRVPRFFRDSISMRWALLIGAASYLIRVSGSWLALVRSLFRSLCSTWPTRYFRAADPDWPWESTRRIDLSSPAASPRQRMRGGASTRCVHDWTCG